jgi:hypothetical protein
MRVAFNFQDLLDLPEVDAQRKEIDLACNAAIDMDFLLGLTFCLNIDENWWEGNRD